MRPSLGITGRAIAGTATLAGCAWAARQELSDAETAWFRRLNDLPDALEPALWPIMQLGSLFGPPVVAAGLRATGTSIQRSLAVFGSGTAAWQLAKLVKARIGRGRPADLLESRRRWGTPSEGQGFVSGHTSVAFAVAATASPALSTPHRALAYGLAVTVGMARVHVSAHLPLDVVGGAALGYALGWTFNVFPLETATDGPDSRTRLTDSRSVPLGRMPIRIR